MRAIVIGGSGQIGGWLLKCLEESGHAAVGTYATVPTPGLIHLDAADRQTAADWVANQKPDVVFYPAGFTWVDGCEKSPEKAYSANLEEPLNLARAVHGAMFVYYSTDYVFDGTSGPNSEIDIPNPLSVYGKAKLDAEHALLNELGDRALILRTSWVFGPERQGKNFAYQLVRTLKSGKRLTAPFDQVSSPSYSPDVARTTVKLVEAGKHGLIHVACPTIIGRVAFAQAIAQTFDIDPNLIDAKSTADLGQGAPRPLNGGLSTNLLESILPGEMRPFYDCLTDFKAKIALNEGWRDPFAD